jgi:hypothetical protein
LSTLVMYRPTKFGFAIVPTAKDMNAAKDP